MINVNLEILVSVSYFKINVLSKKVNFEKAAGSGEIDLDIVIFHHLDDFARIVASSVANKLKNYERS